MRCHAKSKRSQKQCKSWAVKGKKVCRMHGAFGGRKVVTGEHTRARVARRKAENTEFKRLVSVMDAMEE